MEEDKKVNLFVVGAMKAGTTSFVDLLEQHSRVYISPIKEPHYFVDELPRCLYEPSRFFDLDEYFQNDFPKPLHIAKLNTEAQYKQLFSEQKGQQYLVDASTGYLHAPGASQRIYDYNPDAHIVILLRNPLKRSFSHYKMDLGKGRIKKSFDVLMNDQLTAYEDGSLPWYSHLGMSFYKEAVAQYTTLFSKVHVIQFEDLTSRQEDIMNQLSEFLGIDPFDEMVVGHMNKSRSLRFQKGFYFMKQIGLKDYFSKLFSPKFRKWLFEKFSRNEKAQIEISDATRTKLIEAFNKESAL